jgi:CHAT domain-containing protein/tetratricopeptide (TPR) repeat protein
VICKKESGVTQEKTLVLEVFSHSDRLKMSLFEKEALTTTLRHYTDSFITPPQINRLSADIIAVLSNANRKGLLESGLMNELKKMGQLLYDELLTKQIKSKLNKFSSGNLILSVDEQLVSIPWELLFDGESFLCLKFNLGRSVRTSQTEFEPQYRYASSTLRMLILSNPLGDLEFAHKEGMSIINQLDKKRDAIRIDLKSVSIDTEYVKKNLRDYDLVHFAGHCEYNLRNPEDSGWVFKDGNLTARDVLNMSQTLPMPHLIFSNACQSADVAKGLIESEEKIYGLANAFLLSGVRHYIGTFWKVPDEASLVFAKEFYLHLVAGQSVGEAIRRARLSLIKRYGVGSIIWASYLLYGDPTLTLFRRAIKPGKPKIHIRKWGRAHKKQIFASIFSLSAIAAAVLLIRFFTYLNPGVNLLFKQTDALFLQGQNQKVIEICTDIIERDKNFSAAYKRIADTYDRLADRENALKYYFDYALVSEKKNDKKALAQAYLDIAWTYHMQGNYPTAEEFYEKGLSVSRQNRDLLNEAYGLSRLAVWYMEKQNYEKAMELLIKSSEINNERIHIPQHKYNLACDYFNIGLLFADKEDYKSAREFYDKSAKIFCAMQNKSDLSDYYCNMGEICKLEKEYVKALGFYLKSLKIDIELERRWDIGVNYNIIGELYLDIGELAKAEDFFHKALMMRLQIKDAPGLAETYRNLGLLNKKRKLYDKAQEYLQQSLNIYKTIDTPDYQDVEEDLKELSL